MSYVTPTLVLEIIFKGPFVDPSDKQETYVIPPNYRVDLHIYILSENILQLFSVSGL